MGVIRHFSSSSFDSLPSCGGSNQKKDGYYSPSPALENYTIVRHEQFGSNLVVKIKYKDVPNYEGNKIMVYKNCTLKDLQEQKLIDPHFSDNEEKYSPFARFEPTVHGWKIATIVAQII